MKDKIVVIGAGGHGKCVIGTIKKLEKYEILGYTDSINRGLILGVEYLGSDKVLSDLLKKHNGCKAVIGVGNISISDKRFKIYKMLKEIGFNLPVIVSKDASVNEEVIIGEGTVVFEGAIIGVGSIIGKCAIISTRAQIGYGSKIGDFVHLAGANFCSAEVEVGENSVIGMGAIILNNKKIVKNCMIGAGAVIIKDTIIEGSYLGNPARRITLL